MKKKVPPARGARGKAGFLKAPPKTDAIDALLLGADNDDDEDIEGDESLRNDGQPAQIGKNGAMNEGMIERKRSEILVHGNPKSNLIKQ